MDLVALLIRVNLGLVDPETIPILAKDSTFKFVLFCSFPNRKDSIALEMLEGLQEITAKKECNNFELVLRISSEQKGSRWDSDFIRRQVAIQKATRLNKIYVCGPPVMNELFDRTLDSLV